MKNFKRFEKLAKAHGLKVVYTTSDLSGFPRNESCGLIGFDSYDQMLEFAESHRLEPGLFWQENGWSHWFVDCLDEADLCIYNRREYGEMTDYTIYKKDQADDLEQALNAEIAEGDYDEDDNYVKSERELIEELRKLEDGEVLVYDGCNDCYEIDYLYSISWDYDTRHYVIGVK